MARRVDQRDEDPIAIKQAAEYLLERPDKLKKTMYMYSVETTPLYKALHTLYMELFVGKGQYHIDKEEAERIRERYPELMNLLLEYKRKRWDYKRNKTPHAIEKVINKVIGYITHFEVGESFYYVIDRDCTYPYLDELSNDSDTIVDYYDDIAHMDNEIKSVREPRYKSGYFIITKFTANDDVRHHDFIKNNGFTHDISKYVSCFIDSVIDDVVSRSNDTIDTLEFTRRALDPAIAKMREIHGDDVANEHLPYVEAVKNDPEELDFLCTATFRCYYKRLASPFTEDSYFMFPDE